MRRFVCATARRHEIGIVQTLWLHNRLAQAAGADFSAHQAPLDALTRGAPRMSVEQAEDFLASWRVVAQYAAACIPTINDAGGFALTLFQNLATTEYFFALRGVPSAYDELADALGDIVTDKLSLRQIMLAYNYWRRLSAAARSHYPIVTQVALDDETDALRAAYRESSASGLRYESALLARDDIVLDPPTHTVYAIRQVLSPDADGLGVLTEGRRSYSESSV